jgi:hypothetical protein
MGLGKHGERYTQVSTLILYVLYRNKVQYEFSVKMLI